MVNNLQGNSLHYYFSQGKKVVFAFIFSYYQHFIFSVKRSIKQSILRSYRREERPGGRMAKLMAQIGTHLCS